MPSASSGDVPRILSYQGTLADKSGRLFDSATVSMGVRLYSDDQGKAEIWEGWYTPFVTKGLFSIQLGSGNYPLPKNDAIGHALWLGISVNGSQELRPLTPVAASAYALSVADSAITARKMGTDYVSSVQINGQQVTARGGALNFLPGQGISMQYDSGAGGVLINTQRVSQPTPIGTNYWAELGNTGTTPGTNFVGNSDSVALEIHVNDAGTTSSAGRVMVFYPYAASPTIIGGYKGNFSAAYGAVICGGGYASNINSAYGNYSFIGGGAYNSASNGGLYSAVVGGSQNTAGDYYSFVGGGANNSAATYSSIVGGTNNIAGNYSVVAGGYINWDYGTYDFIGGGNENQITGGTYQVDNSVVAGGYVNKINPGVATNSHSSAIGGGNTNTINGSYSAIPGGRNLLLGNNSFGFNGDNSGSTTQIPTYVGGNKAYFGNVDLMIGNVDNSARQLRFYSPNTDVLYQAANAFYTSFRAAAQTANISYILPLNAAPTSVYSALLNDGTGQLLWGDASLLKGAWEILGNGDIVDGTNFLGTTNNVAVTLRVNNLQALRIEPQSASPNLIGGYGGNGVVSSQGCFIGGGGSLGNLNTVYSDYGVICGGSKNTIQTYSTPANYSFIGGGRSNVISATLPHAGELNSYAVITGGFMNNAAEEGTFIGAGDTNAAQEDFNVIAGGSGNSTYDRYAAIVGGADNIVNGKFSFIGGGNNNSIDNEAPNTVISGGQANNITSTIVGHIISGANIPGGVGLTAQSFAQTVIGYYNVGTGTTNGPNNGGAMWNSNDPILIVGNGVDATHQHNAFEVSNSGYSTVYDNTGGPSDLAVPTLPATRGGAHNDNVVYAWGDVAVVPDGHGGYIASMSDGYGVNAGVAKIGNRMTVSLNLADEYGTSIAGLKYLSVTATLNTGNDPGCATIAVSPIYSGGISNSFNVWTHTIPSGTCNDIPLGFSFKVTGRP